MKNARMSYAKGKWANEAISLLPGDLYNYLSRSRSLIDLSRGKAIVCAISCLGFNVKF